MEFKDHPRHKGYSLNRNGIVNGLRRKDIGSTRKDGYRWCHIVGIDKQQYIHRLMWETFKGPIPRGMEINHKDGNKANNCIDNLELMTHKENIMHSYKVLGRTVVSGRDHWLHGKRASAETRRRQSEAKQGAKHPRFKGYYVVNGQRFENASRAGEALGKSAKIAAKWCKNGLNGCGFETV